MRTEAAAIQIDTSLQLSVDFCNRSRPPQAAKIRRPWLDSQPIVPLSARSSKFFLPARRNGGSCEQRERKRGSSHPILATVTSHILQPSLLMSKQLSQRGASTSSPPLSLTLHPLIEEQTSLIERSTSCLKESKQKSPLSLSSQSKHLSVD